MQQYKKILGKVMMTAEGTYDSNKKYDPISLITDEETGKSYISRKEVPVGTQVNNREYWQPVASSGIIDNGVIILNRKNSDGQIPIYDLKSAAEAVAVGDRKGGVILGFLGFNPETDTVPTWKLYQYNDVSPSNWANIDYWLSMDYTNKYAGWFDNEKALYDSVPFPKVGMYAYVGNSASSAVVYRCYNDKVWQPTEDKAFSGVVNLADEEDITSKQNKLKFKDKEYNPAQYNGLGRIYLRKNIVDGKNILTQTMMQATNTIYIIQYDYDLQGETITVPEGCVLDFQGGSLRNGMIIGNNTAITAALTKILGLDIELKGLWNVIEAYPEWFGAKGDGEEDDTQYIQKCITSFNRLDLKSNNYYISNTITCDVGISIYGNNKTILVSKDIDYVFTIGTSGSIGYSTNPIKEFICYVKDGVPSSKQTYLFKLDGCVSKLFQSIKLMPYGIGLVEICNNVWGCTFDNILAFEYDSKFNCVHYIANATNSGEKIVFTNCTISGYENMFKFEKSDYTFSIFISKSALDSPNTILNTGNPCLMTFDQCHFEGSIKANVFIGDENMPMNAMVKINNSYMNFGYVNSPSDITYCKGKISGIINNSYLTNCSVLTNKNIGFIIRNSDTNIFKDIPNNDNLLLDGDLIYSSMIDWKEGQPYGDSMGAVVRYSKNDCISIEPNGGDGGIYFNLPQTDRQQIVVRFKVKRTKSSPSQLHVLMRGYSKETNVQLDHNQDSNIITEVNDEYVQYSQLFSIRKYGINRLYIYANGNGGTGQFQLKDLKVMAY